MIAQLRNPTPGTQMLVVLVVVFIFIVVAVVVVVNIVVIAAVVAHVLFLQKKKQTGFEEAIRQHFRTQQPRLLQQCEQWLSEASEQYKAKMARAIEELRKELALLV